MLLEIDSKIYIDISNSLNNISLNYISSEKDTSLSYLHKTIPNKFKLKEVSEAISPDTYKDWSKDFNWDNYNSLEDFFKTFKNSDKNHNRIYFDLKVNTDNFEVIYQENLKLHKSKNI